MTPGSVPVQVITMPAQVQQPQSQIETALSLPRPDAAALLRAKQDAAQLGQRRNSSVVIAVVGLTALCVVGIGALVWFKTRQGAHPAPAQSVSTESPPAASATALAPGSGAAGEPAALATSTAASSAAGGASGSASAQAAAKAAGASTPGHAASTNPEARENQGFLTIVCSPPCDDVMDGAKSLGPSPLDKVAVRPGPHRLTLKRGSEKRVITLFVQPGQTASQRVAMPK
jgi:serine/threonine-protein kinase